MSRIYKYTSLNTAIRILKSGQISLNNPKNFNDPNDCSFIEDPTDAKQAEQLVVDYFVCKTLTTLNETKKGTSKFKEPEELLLIQKQFEVEKQRLEKEPFFRSNPVLHRTIQKVISKVEPLNNIINVAKSYFNEEIERLVEIAKETALISCFSKRNDSILMWAHYANSHRGICLEYKRPELSSFRDVVYSSNRPFFKVYNATAHWVALEILGKKETEEELKRYTNDIVDPFFVKSTDWQYEEEVRCLFSSDKPEKGVVYDHERKQYYFNIGLPTAIYIGCNAVGSEVDRLKNLADERNIPVFFMKKSANTFNIEIDKNHKYEPILPNEQKEITLLTLINEIDSCLNGQIYLAAFASSLIIPAICSKVECPNATDEKERYIEWCNTFFQYSNVPDCACLNGDVLWNIKEQLFSNGNIDVYGKYGDFELKKILLKIEDRYDSIDHTIFGESDLTTDIAKFCDYMIFQAKRCYKKHKEEIEELSQIPIERYSGGL